MLFLLLVCPKFPLLSRPTSPLSHYASFILLPIMLRHYVYFFVLLSIYIPQSPANWSVRFQNVIMAYFHTDRHIPVTHTGSNEKLEHPAKRNTKHNGHTKTEKSSAARTTNWETKNHPTNYRTLTRFGSGVSVCEGLCSRGNLRKKKIRATKKQLPAGFPLIKMNSILSWTLMEK